MIRKLSDKNKGGIIIREQSKSHWEKKYGVLLLTIVLAIMANLYAGLCYAQTGKWTEAAQYLEKYSPADDQMVSPAAP